MIKLLALTILCLLLALIIGVLGANASKKSFVWVICLLICSIIGAICYFVLSNDYEDEMQSFLKNFYANKTQACAKVKINKTLFNYDWATQSFILKQNNNYVIDIKSCLK